MNGLQSISTVHLDKKRKTSAGISRWISLHRLEGFQFFNAISYLQSWFLSTTKTGKGSSQSGKVNLALSLFATVTAGNRPKLSPH
jgi:hypothetical protein